MKKMLLLLFMLPLAALAQKKVAITIDDLPYAGPGDHSIQNMKAVNDAVLAQLGKHGIKAVGFVNEGKVERHGKAKEKRAILHDWLDAGQELGNHTYSHLKLYDTSLVAFKADVLKGAILTKKLLDEQNQPLRYFRHPYSNTGATAEVKEGLDKFLHAQSYQAAPHTVESSDWLFNAVYAKAKIKGDTLMMQRIAASYLNQTARMFDYFEQQAQKVVGRPIPHIYLCHVNELQADALDELLLMLENKGYTFVSLEEALEDKAYQLEDYYVGKQGPSWLHRWNRQEEMNVLLRQEPALEEGIYELFKNYE